MKLSKTQIQALASEIRKTIMLKNKIVLTETEKRNIKKEIDRYKKFKVKQESELQKMMVDVAKKLNVTVDNLKYNSSTYKSMIDLKESNTPRVNVIDIEKDIILATIDNPASVDDLMTKLISKYTKK